MGVVNVTPDSFSDGGDNLDPAVAVATARRLRAEGAALVDIGGESTRPGADAVSVDEELRRVLPVLEQLAGVPVSIDTSKAEVARQAIEQARCSSTTSPRCAAIPSSRVRSPTPARTFASCTCRGSLARCRSRRGTRTLSEEVAGFLEERLAVAVAAGIPEDHVCLDPGIGFGKTPDQNLGADPWARAALPDRPSGSRRPLAQEHAGARARATRPRRSGTDAASVGAAVAAFDRGAALFRAHDVAAHVEALAAAAAVERGSVA